MSLHNAGSYLIQYLLTYHLLVFECFFILKKKFPLILETILFALNFLDEEIGSKKKKKVWKIKCSKLFQKNPQRTFFLVGSVVLCTALLFATLVEYLRYFKEKFDILHYDHNHYY